MKSILRLSIIALMLMVFTIAINAQDTEEVAEFDISFMMIQEADAGTLSANEDDTFTLTLTGFSEETSWFFEDGRLTGLAQTNLIIEAWNASEEPLAIRTALNFAETARMITVLSNPEYDASSSSITYSAIIINQDDFVNNKGDVAIPETFESLTLMPIMDQDEFAIFEANFQIMQEEASEEDFDFSLLMVQKAQSGTLASHADDTFTLTLTGVPEGIPWFFEDSLESGLDLIALSISAWNETAEPLTLHTSLHLTDGSQILLELSQPEFDAMTNNISYSAIITNPDDFTDLPESFDAATLFFIMNNAEYAIYDVGFQIALNSTRNRNNNSKNRGSSSNRNSRY